MRRLVLTAAVVSVSLLGACKKMDETQNTETTVPAESTATPVKAIPAPIDVAAWAGKWTGPEGMYATITAEPNGNFSLEMQSDLDTKSTYEGIAAADGIRFKRGEETLLLKKATGDETGLKYLAGKTDCLMVKSGEGYCRD